VAVREGQRIEAGEALAGRENGGRRNATLHFEIRRNGDPVDPGALIGR
jgi:septal ring factor EnvC (AmiA/AmiB activator)